MYNHKWHIAAAVEIKDDGPAIASSWQRFAMPFEAAVFIMFLQTSTAASCIEPNSGLES